MTQDVGQWTGLELIGYFQLVGWRVDVPRFYSRFVGHRNVWTKLNIIADRDVMTGILERYPNAWWENGVGECADDLKTMMDSFASQVSSAFIFI